MAAHNYFQTKDSDLVIHLQRLFQEYLVVYTKSHSANSENALMNEERLEMNLKLQGAMNEIALLVIKMKHLKSETANIKYLNQQIISASKRSNRISYSDILTAS